MGWDGTSLSANLPRWVQRLENIDSKAVESFLEKIDDGVTLKTFEKYVLQ